uniref:non-structural maintenance of chromosomes element 4 homolog A n=1 Tax=Ciona intestinalis TaxID=7719 RepID=UPI00006A422B|nr:non-structural maintenance of chromosomes element 4 homolog A [Ciona intestinalis]XP_009862466.1 non-structural maintenance of chromosomes element 4 homolog A [Ciona intestinalis]|eukprot:XP_002132004.1 non-structural maintenance of chromosomes element 4 homolog A [Ciona intestinalis]
MDDQTSDDEGMSYDDASVLSVPVEDSPQSRARQLQLRQNYRKLIDETQLNKEELVKPDSNGLMENIAKAHQLFKDVNETRGAALDSKFMTLAVTLGAQKTNLLQTDLVAFQPDEFIAKLVTCMGGTVSEDKDEIDIPENGWNVLGQKTATYFTSLTPALHPLLGAFEAIETGKTNRQATQRNKQKETSTKVQLPKELTNYKDDKKEATPEEIERVLHIINTFYKDDPSPIDYFELVVNPESYGHTIENIFHLAFLVKDGLVKIFLNENGLPVVEPVNVRPDDISPRKKGKKAKKANNQVIVSLSMDEWYAIIDAYQLKGKQPYIPTPGNC